MIRAHADALGAHARDVVLLTSELVTNAVRHGGEPIELKLAIEGPTARVAVCDGGSDGLPALRACGDDGGYGLHLVQAIAARWGLGERSHEVWFEIDLDVAPREPRDDGLAPAQGA